MFKSVSAIAMALFMASHAQAKPAVEVTAATPYTIPNSERWNIASKITGRTYRIAVYRPIETPPKGGFPVLFTTDGDVFFPLATGQMLIRRLGEIQPAVIVGISYPTDDVTEIVRLRTRDLTPKPMSADVLKAMAAYKVAAADGGGAELFYRFITEELRPELAQRYPIDGANQTLFGHSLGGLFALHVLFNHPTAFRNYVAASPSIAWSDDAILADVPGFKAKLKTVPAPNVLMMVGGNESSPDAIPTAAMSRDAAAAMAAKSPMVGNMKALAARLRGTADGPSLDVETAVFPDENHVSVQPASMARALSFALANPTWGKPCTAPCKAAPAK